MPGGGDYVVSVRFTDTDETPHTTTYATGGTIKGVVLGLGIEGGKVAFLARNGARKEIVYVPEPDIQVCRCKLTLTLPSGVVAYRDNFTQDPLPETVWDDYEIHNWGLRPSSIWVQAAGTQATGTGEKTLSLEYKVEVEIEPENNWSGQVLDSVTLKCIEADLDGDVSDDEDTNLEENLGVFLGSEPKQLNLGVTGPDVGVEGTYTLTWQGDDKVSVSDGYGEIFSPATRQMNQNSVTVTAKSPSAAYRDVHFNLKYEGHNVVTQEDLVKMTILGLDLEGAGVAEESETDPAAYLGVNDDNDNSNGALDKDEFPVQGEDDLLAVTLHRPEPGALPGTDEVILEWSEEILNGQRTFDVYAHADKTGGPLTSGQHYALGDLPVTVYVEGRAASGAVRLNNLTLSYTTHNTLVQDVIRFTIVDVASVVVHSSDPQTEKVVSSLGASGLDHFVTAKDQGDVVLVCTPVPDTQEFRDLIEWEAGGVAMTCPAVESDKRTAKFSSAVASGLKVPLGIKIAGKSCWNGLGWVVWSENEFVDSTQPQEQFKKTWTEVMYTEVSVGYTFRQKILPMAIIDDPDHPDLTGPRTVDTPIVPALDDHVYNHGNTSLANGASHRWDTSRQARLHVINPANLDFAGLFGFGAPKFTTYDQYPSDETCGNVGNDDPSWQEEDNVPYDSPMYRLVGPDAPYYPLKDSVGANGDTFEARVHFRVFARLQLAGAWYRISSWDGGLFRVHFKFRKEDTAEASIDRDINGDLDKTDTFSVWRDDGTSAATDNSGF